MPSTRLPVGVPFDLSSANGLAPVKEITHVVPPSLDVGVPSTADASDAAEPSLEPLPPELSRDKLNAPGSSATARSNLTVTDRTFDRCAVPSSTVKELT